jgi:hypothetical protein
MGQESIRIQLTHGAGGRFARLSSRLQISSSCDDPQTKNVSGMDCLSNEEPPPPDISKAVSENGIQ